MEKSFKDISVIARIQCFIFLVKMSLLFNNRKEAEANLSSCQNLIITRSRSNSLTKKELDFVRSSKETRWSLKKEIKAKELERTQKKIIFPKLNFDSFKKKYSEYFNGQNTEEQKKYETQKRKKEKKEYWSENVTSKYLELKREYEEIKRLSKISIYEKETSERDELRKERKEIGRLSNINCY